MQPCMTKTFDFMLKHFEVLRSPAVILLPVQLLPVLVRSQANLPA